MSRVACRVSRVWWQHLFDALLFVSNVWLCAYAGVGGLSKELTVAEMDARIAFLEVDNVEKEAKLERLRTSSAGLTQAEVTKLRRKYDGAKAEWRKRKRKVRAPYRWRADDSSCTRLIGALLLRAVPRDHGPNHRGQRHDT